MQSPHRHVLRKHRIARIGASRLWLFPQLRGDSAALDAGLSAVDADHKAGDAFVFLGSQIGEGRASLDVIRTLEGLQQRADGPVVWLRGVQEELLIRLLTLHLAPDPADVLAWMDREHRLGALLTSLGVDLHALTVSAQAGAAPLAVALKPVRAQLEPILPYLEACDRAAVSDNGQVLMVHGGVDPARPLSLQTDAFWWGHPDFFRMTGPFASFAMVYSTRTPAGQGRVEGPGRLAFDTGAGRGGLARPLCIQASGGQI